MVDVPVRSILKKSRGIHVRDLLALSIQTDSSDQSGDHLILPRGEAVMMKIGHIKAITWRDSAYLFDSHRPDVVLFSSTLQNSLVQLPASPSEHFELFFLEEVLREVCDTWDRRIKLYSPVVDKVVSGVGDGTGDSGIHRLVPLKDSLMEFQVHVESLVNTLNTLLENDDDMVSLLLTEKWIAKKEGKELDLSSHEVVELLLEDYSRQLHSVLGSITKLLGRVQTAQDHYAIKLSTYRNDMIRMNVSLSIMTVSMGFATMVAGFFGMNVTHGLEDSSGVFLPVVVGSMSVGGAIYLACISHLSGGAAQYRGKMRAMEAQSVTGVLRDMNSLDYAFKKVIDEGSRGAGGRGEGTVGREDFRMILETARGGGRVTDGELQLIFDIIDESGDGVFQKGEFRKLDLEWRKAAVEEEQEEVEGGEGKEGGGEGVQEDKKT